MSLLTFNELEKAVADGVMTGVNPSHINAASIDVTLGPVFYYETGKGQDIDLARKEVPEMIDLELEPGQVFHLCPGEFILAQTNEVFHLPNDIAGEFRLKSSSARAGLDCALAVWLDPGWHGSVLTLELRNNLRRSRLTLTPGMKIGQIVLFRGEPVPDHRSYAVTGRYNNDLSAQPSRGLQ